MSVADIQDQYMQDSNEKKVDLSLEKASMYFCGLK
jgi:hypothetical protein